MLYAVTIRMRFALQCSDSDRKWYGKCLGKVDGRVE